MGKITSTYLTDKEAEEMDRFCSMNGCTQHSAMKTALKQLLNKPVKTEEISQVNPQQQTFKTQNQKNLIEEDLQTPKKEPSQLVRLLEAFRSIDDS